jgi:hypothetical protein
MTTYFSITHSNYFRVGNHEKFTRWCEKRGIEYKIHNHNELGNCYAISAADENMGWPFYDDDTDDDIDLYAELARHLDDRDVAILFEVGFEGSRYLRGFARAIHPDGRILCLDLPDIYERARESFGTGINITPDSMLAAEERRNACLG